jgi:hypothetical protein
MDGLPLKNSTTICASLDILGFPLSIRCASCAPAGDLKWRIAERNPGSSLFSAESTSASRNSLDQTTIDLNESSVVFKGSRLIKIAQGPDVEMLTLLGVTSLSNEFTGGIDRGYD